MEQICIEKDRGGLRLQNIETGKGEWLKTPYCTGPNKIFWNVSTDGTQIILVLPSHPYVVKIIDINTMNEISTFNLKLETFQDYLNIYLNENEIIASGEGRTQKYSLEGEILLDICFEFSTISPNLKYGFKLHYQYHAPKPTTRLQFICFDLITAITKVQPASMMNYETKSCYEIKKLFTSDSLYFVFASENEVSVFDMEKFEFSYSFKLQECFEIAALPGGSKIIYQEKADIEYYEEKLYIYDVAKRQIEKVIVLTLEHHKRLFIPTLQPNIFFVKLSYHHQSIYELQDDELVEKCKIRLKNDRILFGMRRVPGAYTKGVKRI